MIVRTKRVCCCDRTCVVTKPLSWQKYCILLQQRLHLWQHLPLICHSGHPSLVTNPAYPWLLLILSIPAADWLQHHSPLLLHPTPWLQHPHLTGYIPHPGYNTLTSPWVQHHSPLLPHPTSWLHHPHLTGYITHPDCILLTSYQLAFFLTIYVFGSSFRSIIKQGHLVCSILYIYYYFLYRFYRAM